MLPDAGREHLLPGLTATPLVVLRLMRPAWPGIHEHRPDPARFTLREARRHRAERLDG